MYQPLTVVGGEVVVVLAGLEHQVMLHDGIVGVDA